jgi:UDP-GlcNAc:undecaprenyl-phosphate GlcNAc-1-phosphate transferase
MGALLAPIKRFTALAFFVPILALLLPLLESVFSIGRRSLALSNPFRGDTGHLHNQLQRAGMSDRQILLIYNSVAAVVGVFCIGFRFANRRVLAALLGIFVLSVLAGLGIILRRRKQDADTSAN